MGIRSATGNFKSPYMSDTMTISIQSHTVIRMEDKIIIYDS